MQAVPFGRGLIARVRIGRNGQGRGDQAEARGSKAGAGQQSRDIHRAAPVREFTIGRAIRHACY
jgi:hypothetical protein